MPQEKKLIHTKPHLIIRTSTTNHLNNQQSPKDHSNHNEVFIKPLSSAKNYHHKSIFNFDQENVEALRLQKKTKKLQKLQLEKQDLIRSLHILKKGAISAIAEKQEQIEKLKLKQHLTGEEQLQFYERELEMSQSLRKDLESEKRSIERDLEEQKDAFLRQIEEKQQIIQQLEHQVESMNGQLNKYEVIEELKSKKIRMLEEENYCLSQQIQMSNFSISKPSEKSNRSDFNESFKFNLNNSVSSFIPRKNSEIQSSSQLLQTDLDYTFFTQKIQEIKKNHVHQILNLTTYYENRISAIREIYKRQSSLPKLQRYENIDSPSEKKISSTHSNRGFDKDHKLQKSNSNQEFQKERSLTKNNSYQTSSKAMDMYIIDEKIEQELYKSKNLKEEIQQIKISECLSDNKRFDTESQFTNRYFEYPLRFKKNKSLASITSKQSTVNEPLKPQNSNNWKTGLVFTLGVAIGGSIATVLPPFFKK